MIGTKKLSTIREEIQKSLSRGGADPIQWLEKQIATRKRKGDGTEVLEGLKQFLESAPKRRSRKRRVAAKG
jgi:hypothetical protein